MRQFYPPIEAATANVVDLRAVPEGWKRQDGAGPAGPTFLAEPLQPVVRSGRAVPHLLTWACLFPLLGLLASCGSPPASPGGCGELPCDSQRSFTRTFQTSATARLDLLFVVDDTPAIAPYTASVTTALSAFATTLTVQPGREPSLHVRFVPATVPSPDCPAASRAVACGVADETLQTGLCGSDPSFPGGLSDAFACLGDRGANGCGTLQPLEAARRALAAAGDFLRPDAYLAIIVVAGADDASMSPVDTYVDFIKSLKVDPANQLFASVIAPAAPACSDAATGEPVRLGAFARAFGRNGQPKACAPRRGYRRWRH